MVTDNGANTVKAIKLLRQVDEDMDEHDANDDDSVQLLHHKLMSRDYILYVVCCQRDAKTKCLNPWK